MQQTIIPPDLDDLLEESRNAVFANLNCVQIGKLEKVNDDQTVEIKIQFLRRVQNGETRAYPLLVDCPYFVLQGGGAYIDMPIKKGDDCLVLFNDRNIDDWWDTANVAVPSDTRKHSIADGFALVGINSRTNALPYSGSDFRLFGPTGANSFINFKSDGSIEINAPAGLKITADTEITGTLTVSGIIKSLVDIIADYAGSAISLLTHFHQGNLGFPTGTPIQSGGGTTPSSLPTADANGEITDGNGTKSTNHKHSQANDSGGNTEQDTGLAQ